MNCSYTKIIRSKSGLKIPLKNEIPLNSKYAPEKEALAFAEQFDYEKTFFIIAGICGGYHLDSLLKKNPARKIIAVESSDSDIGFLRQIPCVEKLEKDGRVVFATVKTLKAEILNNYLPAFYGNLTAAGLRSWKDCFPQSWEKVKNTVDDAVKDIQRDFSVQARFAKVWTHNIFSNLQIFEKAATFSELKNLYAEKKTAAVIAAGPTLDKSIEKLKNAREKYIIIATDTAFSVLLKRGIFPEICVSVDAQMISENHFFNAAKTRGKTIFAFDLSGNSSAVRSVAKQKLPFFFFETGHPLSKAASLFDGKKHFLSLDAGSGTVTVAAYNLAQKIGFSKIELFGADFAYSGGKPYCKGTYLDELYAKDQNRLNPVESAFSKLMYRTELIQTDAQKFTTEVLTGYKKSLEALQNSFQQEEKNAEKSEFNPEEFKSFLKENLNRLSGDFETDKKNSSFWAILPLAAFYGRFYPAQNAFELARQKTLGYTDKHYDKKRF